MPIEKIRLNQGYYTIVDRQDAVFTCMHNYYVKKSEGSRILYAQRNATIERKHKNFTLHHDIVERMGIIVPKGMEIDHINRDGLDNTRNNFRIVNKSLQSLNRDIISTNTSGHRGVHWEQWSQKWRAAIVIDGREYKLGRYTDIEDAIAARKEAEIKYLGEEIQ